jgi:FkbM family methyltransferase
MFRICSSGAPENTPVQKTNYQWATILKFITGHPLNRGRPISALARFVAWQLISRVKTQHLHSWVDGTKLVVHKGMTGATGNIYCGLHEFADMAFVLHVLKPTDVFLDVGANVGSYTVLASGVCGARTLAFEPDPKTVEHLRRNIEINGLDGLVEVHQVALGSTPGETAFTVGRETVNRVAELGEADTQTVPMRRLDDISGARQATLIKLDVEGYEAEVLAGAREVLASPTVLAVETESQDAATLEALIGAGFIRRWYEPWSRTLLQAQPTDLKNSNALFLRDETAVLDRVNAAPRRRVQGNDL